VVWHDDEWRERDLDVEAAVPVPPALAAAGGANARTVREVPGEATLACVIHRGSLETIGDAYLALSHWIEQNDYALCGPRRDVVHRYRSGPATDGTPSENEIQFPVTKSLNVSDPRA
jgi:effector-binding domain-containing protein